MQTNDLMGIGQIRETSDIREVNANLEKGWKLLLAYTYAPYGEYPNDLESRYSLGWPAELGEPDFIDFQIFD